MGPGDGTQVVGMAACGFIWLAAKAQSVSGHYYLFGCGLGAVGAIVFPSPSRRVLLLLSNSVSSHKKTSLEKEV